MEEPSDFIDKRLGKLASATDALRPGAGFEDRVMAAIGVESAVRWFDPMWRVGRVAVLAGALAAAASVVLAMQVQSGLDEQVLATFEMVEWDE